MFSFKVSTLDSQSIALMEPVTSLKITSCLFSLPWSWVSIRFTPEICATSAFKVTCCSPAKSFRDEILIAIPVVVNLFECGKSMLVFPCYF